MIDDDSYDLLYKIIIIGDSNVGKSNILSRYTKDQFQGNSKATVGVELGTKFVKVEGVGAKLQIWDTAGQERYRSLTSSYYKGCHGCFIVYDITNEQSFESINTWYEQAVKEAGKEVSIILVGNKCDLENERKVSKEKGEEKAKTMNASFFETSALSKVNIDDIFKEIVNNIYQRTKGQKNDDDDDIEIISENEKAINLAPQQTPEKKGCC
jgi:small GTP-binding protein